MIWEGLLQSSSRSCCLVSSSLDISTLSSMWTEGGAGAVAAPPLPVGAHLIPFVAACRCFLHWPVHTSLPPYEQLLIAAVAGSALHPIRNPSVNTLIREGVAWSSLSLSSFSIVLIAVLVGAGGCWPCWGVLGCFPRWWLVTDVGGRWAYAYLVVNGAPVVHHCCLFTSFL
jgi:hypothetical protein